MSFNNSIPFEIPAISSSSSSIHSPRRQTIHAINTDVFKRKAKTRKSILKLPSDDTTTNLAQTMNKRRVSFAPGATTKIFNLDQSLLPPPMSPPKSSPVRPRIDDRDNDAGQPLASIFEVKTAGTLPAPSPQSPSKSKSMAELFQINPKSPSLFDQKLPSMSPFSTEIKFAPNNIQEEEEDMELDDSLSHSRKSVLKSKPTTEQQDQDLISLESPEPKKLANNNPTDKSHNIDSISNSKSRLENGGSPIGEQYNKRYSFVSHVNEFNSKLVESLTQRRESDARRLAEEKEASPVDDNSYFESLFEMGPISAKEDFDNEQEKEESGMTEVFGKFKEAVESNPYPAGSPMKSPQMFKGLFNPNISLQDSGNKNTEDRPLQPLPMGFSKSPKNAESRAGNKPAEEQDMEFTFMPRKPTEEQDMDFTSMPKDSEQDMDFTSMPKNSLENEEQEMEFTSMPQHSAPVEQDMDFTSLPKKTAETEEQDMDFTSMPKTFVDKSSYSVSEEQDMEFTFMPKKPVEQDMEFTTIANREKERENTKNQEQEMEFTMITSKDSQSSQLQQKAGSDVSDSDSDGEKDLDLTTIAPIKPSDIYTDSEGEEEMDMTTFPNKQTHAHDDSFEKSFEQEMEMTTVAGATKSSKEFNEEKTMDLTTVGNQINLTHLRNVFRQSTIPQQNEREKRGNAVDNVEEEKENHVESNALKPQENLKTREPFAVLETSKAQDEFFKDDFAKGSIYNKLSEKSENVQQATSQSDFPSTKYLKSLLKRPRASMIPNRDTFSPSKRRKTMPVNMNEDFSTPKKKNQPRFESRKSLAYPVLDNLETSITFTPLRKNNKPTFDISQIREPLQPEIDNTPVKEQRVDIRQPEPQLTIDEFLSKIGISFLNSNLPNHYNPYSTGYLESLERFHKLRQEQGVEASSRDYIKALVHLSRLDLYKFENKEMKKNVQEAQQIIKEIEEDGDLRNSDMFQQYLKSLKENNEEEADRLAGLFKRMRQYKSLEAKRNWFKWQQQMTEELYLGLKSQKQEFESAEMELSRYIGKIIDPNNNNNNKFSGKSYKVEDLQNFQEEMERRLVKETQELAELESMNQRLEAINPSEVEEIIKVHDDLVKQMEEVNKYQAGMQETFEKEEQKFQELGKMEKELLAQVKEGKKFAEMRKEIKQVGKMQKTCEALKQISGIEIKQLITNNNNNNNNIIIKLSIFKTLQVELNIETFEFTNLVYTGKVKQSSPFYEKSKCLYVLVQYLAKNVGQLNQQIGNTNNNNNDIRIGQDQHLAERVDKMCRIWMFCRVLSSKLWNVAKYANVEISELCTSSSTLSSSSMSAEEGVSIEITSFNVDNNDVSRYAWRLKVSLKDVEKPELVFDNIEQVLKKVSKSKETTAAGQMIQMFEHVNIVY